MTPVLVRINGATSTLRPSAVETSRPCLSLHKRRWLSPSKPVEIRFIRGHCHSNVCRVSAPDALSHFNCHARCSNCNDCARMTLFGAECDIAGVRDCLKFRRHVLEKSNSGVASEKRCAKVALRTLGYPKVDAAVNSDPTVRCCETEFYFPFSCCLHVPTGAWIGKIRSSFGSWSSTRRTSGLPIYGTGRIQGSGSWRRSFRRTGRTS